MPFSTAFERCGKRNSEKCDWTWDVIYDDFVEVMERHKKKYNAAGFFAFYSLYQSHAAAFTGTRMETGTPGACPFFSYK